MTNFLETFEKEQIDKLISKKRIPRFRPGDTLKITVKIIEGEKSRLQAFEGVCVARKNNGLNSNFTVRKISHGEGVERVFPLFSPLVDKIEIIRKGDVRRAKLYYLRNRKGKSARIVDSNRGEEADQYSLKEELLDKEVIEDSKAEDKPAEDKKEAKAEDKPAEDKKEAKAEDKPAKEKKEDNPIEEKSDSSNSKKDNSENEQPK
tara:strand:+ start:733 stop:1347 length:615 start_codon:yes stop_codon:yes gene_type:complete